MKLRMQHNSIRFRLNQKDIEKLQSELSVAETIYMAGNTSLKYTLALEKDVNAISARYYGNEIMVVVPAKIAEEWISTEQEGLYESQSLLNALELKISIEKDYKCLTDRPEDDKHAFPNPIAKEGGKC